MIKTILYKRTAAACASMDFGVMTSKLRHIARHKVVTEAMSSAVRGDHVGTLSVLRSTDSITLH